jgi:predicted PurR-regulated permease PerM
MASLFRKLKDAAPTPPSPPGSSETRARRQQVWLAAMLVVAGLLVWKLNHILLLLFGAILLAVLLRTIAEPFERYLKLPQRLAVLAALVSLLVLISVGAWAFGREIESQLSALTEQLPGAWAALREQLTPDAGEGEGSEADLAVPTPETAAGGSAPRLPVDIFANVGAFAALVVTVLSQLGLVVFAGLFLALNPQSYRSGAVALVERINKRAAEKTGRAIELAGTGLKRWILAQLITMVIIGVVTGLGAWAIGLPSPLALGIIAGALEFVTLVGPILAFIPAILLAATIGPEMMLWTIVLYVVIQQAEGNILIPLMQKRMVALPPVIALFAIIISAALFGPLGVVLAAPMAVCVFVILKGVYLEEDVFGEDGSPKGA